MFSVPVFDDAGPPGGIPADAGLAAEGGADRTWLVKSGYGRVARSTISLHERVSCCALLFLGALAFDRFVPRFTVRQPGVGRGSQVVRHRALGDTQGGGDLGVGQRAFVLETQNFSNSSRGNPVGWHRRLPEQKGASVPRPKVRITTHCDVATAIPSPNSGHRDRQADRGFRHGRKSGHHPSETPVNIVGFGGHHPSETPVTFRRNTQ